MESVRPMDAAAELAITDEIRVGDYVAQRLSDDMSWGEGSIRPVAEHTGEEDQHALVRAAIESIEEVTDGEQDMSYCTDGRLPVRLLDGSTALPVRQKLVGASLVPAFYIAESLGDRFYADPTAPVAQRVARVAEFLKDNGITPSGHLGCGAGTNFVPVAANIPRFAQNGAFMARTRFFLPEGVYDEDLHVRMMQAAQQRLAAGAYEGLSLQTFLDAVERVGGTHALAELRDDGRGVHGHVEEDVLRLRVGNRAINVVKLAQLTDGRELFDVNDDANDHLAALFARGDDTDYQVARMSVEDFTNGGHGSLAKDLPTWQISVAA